jgi:hypothetical protein
MFPANRITAILLVVVSISGLILLSGGISDLSLKPGTLYRDGLIGELQGLLWASRGFLDFMLILFILLPVIIAILIFLHPVRSKQTSQRKRSIISSLVQLVLFISAILLLRRRVNWQDFQLSLSEGIPQSVAKIEFNASEYALNTLPWWLDFILSFLLIGTALFFIARAISASQRKVDPADLISKEADLAVREINQGKSFNNVILDCYHEMTRIFSEQHGISRGETITPREFEKYLLNLGFPEKSVTWLTRLFERVRYGKQEIDEKNQNLAINCLEEIREMGEDLR